MKNSKNLLIAGLTVFATSLATAGPTGSYYGELGYAAIKIKNDNNGFSVTPKLIRLTAGKEVHENLAVEVSYGFTPSKESSTFEGEKFMVKESFYGGFLKPKVEIVKDVEAFARIGAARLKLEDSETSVSKNRVAYGLGILARFTKDIYGQLDYMNYYKKDGVTAQGFALAIGMNF